MYKITKRTRGRLPHWETQDAIYFVTFRLADSLPQHVLIKLREEHREFQSRPAASDTEASNRSNVRYIQSINQTLDRGIGDCFLAQPRIAEIVVGALLHFNKQRYCLHAWCVMPNHVHLVFSLASNETLSRVMHSIKRYTAKEANAVLGRSGRFWQEEYYDHIVRNEKAYERIVDYVRSNPAQADLVEWPFVSSDTEAIGWSDDGSWSHPDAPLEKPRYTKLTRD